MVLADFVILWIGGALLIGFVGFFVVVAGLILRFMIVGFRSVFGSDDDDLEPPAHLQGSPGSLIRCENTRCQHLNSPAARYCAHCGRPL